MAMGAIPLSAGRETTSDLIANDTLALVQHPAWCDRLRTDRVLTEAAVVSRARSRRPAPVAAWLRRVNGGLIRRWPVQPGAPRSAGPQS